MAASPPVGLPELRLADTEAGVVLRPWGAPPGDTEHDAAALAAAWADPEVARWTAVPGGRDRDAAARWLVGEGRRRERGLALDLVVGSADDGGREVLGEVGLTRFDDAGRAELGFWLAPAARGRGRATAAVRLVAQWALAPTAETGHRKWLPSNHFLAPEPRTGLGLRRVWARTDPGNARAASVLVRAGFRRRGEAAGYAVWTLDAASLRA